MEHTPGPWKIDDSDELNLGVIQDDDDGMGICEVGNMGVTRNNALPESWANARLIAAAPESYQGCIVARNIAGIFNIMVGDHYSDQDIVAALDGLLDNPIWEQAIAKATGGE